MIYLDYNAHAPLLKSAHMAMIAALNLDGNPSSVHKAGRVLRKMLDDARQMIKKSLDANEHDLTFTSGASEANAQVINTFRKVQANLFISAIEHDSIMQSASQASSGVHIIPVTQDGIVDLEALEQMLCDAGQANPKLVSVMAANNETGIIQPIQDVVAIAQKHHALVHVDATQAVGRLTMSFNDWDVDYLTCSSHKIGGPLGAGALISRRQATLTSLIEGGAQELNRRAGTENVPAIVGFAAALKEMQNHDWYITQALRDNMEQALRNIYSNVMIHGQNIQRLANTSCIHMPGVDSMIQVVAFDLEGIAVSAGSACSSGKVKSSAVLKAMGCSESVTRESIRISLCPTTSAPDMAKFLDTWQMIYQRAHRMDAINNNHTVTDLNVSIRKASR